MDRPKAISTVSKGLRSHGATWPAGTARPWLSGWAAAAEKRLPGPWLHSVGLGNYIRQHVARLTFGYLAWDQVDGRFDLVFGAADAVDKGELEPAVATASDSFRSAVALPLRGQDAGTPRQELRNTRRKPLLDDFEEVGLLLQPREVARQQAEEADNVAGLLAPKVSWSERASTWKPRPGSRGRLKVDG